MQINSSVNKLGNLRPISMYCKYKENQRYWKFCKSDRNLSFHLVYKTIYTQFYNKTNKQKKIDEWGPFCIFLPALFNILLWYMTFVYVYLKGYSSAFQHNLMHLPHLITTDKMIDDLIRPCAEKERKTCILKLNHNENLRAMNSIPSIDIYLKHVEHFLCMYVCM